MKAPNKFWFYHHSDKNIIYFAEGDEYEYVISGGDLEHPTSRSPDEVESFFQKGYWVITVPSKFKVRGILTDNIYSFIKDANNLYVMTGGSITSPIFHYEEEVLASLYGDKQVWEVHDEEQIKELTTPDTFKFRHVSDRTHIGQIYSATRCNGGYRIEWVDGNAVEPCKMMYSNEEVECRLSGGDWIVVEEVFAKEEPSVKKQISININDVYAAAKFDVEHNKHTKASVSDVEKEIISYIKTMYADIMAGKLHWGRNYTATRSYHIVFRPESDNYGVISVLSSASAGMPVFFADVAEFLNQN